MEADYLNDIGGDNSALLEVEEKEPPPTPSRRIY